MESPIRPRATEITQRELALYTGITPPFLKWMHKNQHLTSEEVIELATIEYEKGSRDKFIEELALLLSDQSDEVPGILEEVQDDDIDEDAFAEKMLYVEMSWLYSARDKVRDPLSRIELIYSEYNYPSEISHLVRYMPGDTDSDEEIMTAWHDWLIAMGRVHGAKNS